MITTTVSTKLQRTRTRSVAPSETPNTFRLDISRAGAWVNAELRDTQDLKVLATYGWNTRERRWSYDNKPTANVVKLVAAFCRGELGTDSDQHLTREQQRESHAEFVDELRSY